jgi:uncharacterized protein
MTENFEPHRVTGKLNLGKRAITLVCGLPPDNNTDNCVLLAHGVKGSINSSNVSYLHDALADRGFLTVKFNFPFAEGRLRLARRPEKNQVLVECYRTVIKEVRQSEWKPKNLILGGISLGAAIASHVISDGPDQIGVKGLFFLSYPIHLPRKPDAMADSHLDKIHLPMLFVSGNRDIYAEEQSLRMTVSRLGPRASLHMIDADHGFNKRHGKAIYSKTLGQVAGIIDEWAKSNFSR